MILVRVLSSDPSACGKDLCTRRGRGWGKAKGKCRVCMVRTLTSRGLTGMSALMLINQAMNSGGLPSIDLVSARYVILQSGSSPCEIIQSPIGLGLPGRQALDRTEPRPSVLKQSCP